MKNIDKVKRGDWIFTCRMEPVQFSHVNPKSTKDYNKKYISSLKDDDLSNFINDNFETVDGSNHSFENCGCHLISEAYAKWFLENNVHELYDQFKDKQNSFELYQNAVKHLCVQNGIDYEGI